jgi:hypothetical protein
VRLEGLAALKIFNGLVGTRICDLPVSLLKLSYEFYVHELSNDVHKTRSNDNLDYAV